MRNIIKNKKMLITYYVKLFGTLYKNMKGLRVITFHSISNETSINHLNRSVFEKFIQFLIVENYQTINLSEIIRDREKILTNNKLVAITFDDGFYNNYEIGLEILKKNNIKATFFIPTCSIAAINGYAVGSEMAKYKNIRLMNWDNIIELKDAGFEIGSHSHSHIKLAQYSNDRIRRELEWSKEILEKFIGCEVNSFAYPYGMIDTFSKVTRDILEKVGYKIGCTQMGGSVSNNCDLLQLPRTAIANDDTLETIISKVVGRYDCVNFINSKWFRKIIGK